MIKNKKGESLVGILMGMFILGLVLLGIANILINSRELNTDALNDSNIYFIKNNSINALNNLNFSSLSQGEEFYLYKDKIAKTISILTGATNSGSIYVDRYGYRIDDIVNFPGFIYTQSGTIKIVDTNLGFKYTNFELTVKQYNKTF